MILDIKPKENHMKLVATSIVALFATVAFANTTATATATAPAATTGHEATATATAPKAEAKAGKVEAKATAKEDCTKLTGEAKAKCETSAKATTHK
jgi:hypothetical protein